MNRMEINGPGAEFRINLKMYGEATVNKVETNRGYTNTPYFRNPAEGNSPKNQYQSLRWMERYLLSLNGILESDTITICGTLGKDRKSGHRLGYMPMRADMDLRMLEKQGELIAEETGLCLQSYIDLTTRISNCALCIPFDIRNPYVTADADAAEGVYIITIQELGFKKQCNEAIKKFLEWCDGQNVTQESLFLKKFCDIKSDRLRAEEQKQTAYAYEVKKQEETKEWEARTQEYIQGIDWSSIAIGLGFVAVTPDRASVELCLEGLPENELYHAGILLPKKVQFVEQEPGITTETSLDYFSEDFKTRLLCAAVKHINEEYRVKYPEYYEYKKWHTLCERRDYAMEFSKKFTYYSEEQLGIVKGDGVSFAEWERTAEPGKYEELFADGAGAELTSDF